MSSTRTVKDDLYLKDCTTVHCCWALLLVCGWCTRKMSWFFISERQRIRINGDNATEMARELARVLFERGLVKIE